MNSRYAFAILILSGAIVASPASAERVKQNSVKANAAFDTCMDTGAPMKESGGTTSCLSLDGHGITCGGTPEAIKKDPSLKGTCDTFRRSPKQPWADTASELARVNLTKKSKPAVASPGASTR